MFWLRYTVGNVRQNEIATTNRTMKKASHEENHIAEIVKVATGQLAKKDYAAILEIDPTRVSQRLPGDYERAIKVLQAEKIQLQADVNEAQEKISDLQSQVRELKGNAANLQESVTNLKTNASEIQKAALSLQADKETLQGEIDKMQAVNTALQASLKDVESRVLAFSGKPPLIRFFGSSQTRAILAVLLAVFEVAGAIHLLSPKGLLMAVPVGVAMGYSLLAFASSDNKPGKWVCILFSFAIGALYFEPWNTRLWQDVLFALFPPIVNATIINSFNRK